MEHNKSDNKETSSRGADWEVVSLTASAYAASPGPDPEEVVPADNSSNLEGEDESAKAMFMSGHFMFPPNEHESLPLESDISGVAAETIVPDVDPIEIEETVEPIKIQYGNLSTEISPEADEAHGIKFFDKGERVSVHDDDFEDGNQQIFVTESVVPSDQSSSSFPKAIKKSKGKGSGFPSEAWWKKRAASLYAHAKEASTFWSLCVAAAVMGFVIMGQRWQQEKWQIHYLPSRISISDEIAGRFLGRFRHFKDALVGGHRRAPILQGAPADI